MNLAGMTEEAAREMHAYLKTMVEMYGNEREKVSRMRSDPHGPSGRMYTEMRAAMSAAQRILDDFEFAADAAGLIRFPSTKDDDATIVDRYLRIKIRGEPIGWILDVERMDGACQFVLRRRDGVRIRNSNLDEIEKAIPL